MLGLSWMRSESGIYIACEFEFILFRTGVLDALRVLD